MESFQSTLDDIEEHVQSLEWKTDTGHTLHGVLIRRDNRVILNINSRLLSGAVNFEYLYRDNWLGGRRTLYPYDVSAYKHIPKTETEAYPIEIRRIADEHKTNVPEIDNSISFTYDSFIWDKYPETKSEERKSEKLFAKIRNMDTSLGKVTVTTLNNEVRSMHPSSYEKRVEGLYISVTPTQVLTDDEILMWNRRFSQLLTFLHKERVITKAISRGGDKLTVPELIENYEEANYAHREMVFARPFVDIVSKALPAFVDDYDQIASFIEDLTQYYRDYPLDPPDGVQLLRLFTSMEQCAIHSYDKKEILVRERKQSDAAKKKREAEFKRLLKLTKENRSVPRAVDTYLRDVSKKYYVSPSTALSPKHKIVALAELLCKRYKVSNCLRNPTDVKVIYAMRDVVAHGYYDQKATDTFYTNRDKYGQDIEEFIRMYILRTLGCTPMLLLKNRPPLKARQFNNP